MLYRSVWFTDFLVLFTAFPLPCVAVHCSTCGLVPSAMPLLNSSNEDNQMFSCVFAALAHHVPHSLVSHLYRSVAVYQLSYSGRCFPAFVAVVCSTCGLAPSATPLLRSSRGAGVLRCGLWGSPRASPCSAYWATWQAYAALRCELGGLG